MANRDGNRFSQRGRRSRLAESSGGVTSIQFVTHEVDTSVRQSVLNVPRNQWRRGGVGVFKPPPPRNSEGPPKLCQTHPDL